MGNIQNAINQMIGTVGVARRLGPGYDLKMAEQKGQREAQAKAAETIALAEPAVKAAQKIYGEYDIQNKKFLGRGRPKEGAFDTVMDLNEKALSHVRKALSLNPDWKEGYTMVRDLEEKRDILVATEESRTADDNKGKKANKKAEQIQNFKSKQKKVFQDFVNYVKQLEGGK